MDILLAAVCVCFCFGTLIGFALGMSVEKFRAAHEIQIKVVSEKFEKPSEAESEPAPNQTLDEPVPLDQPVPLDEPVPLLLKPDFVVVTRTGKCFHLTASCHYAAGRPGLQKLEMCTHCWKEAAKASRDKKKH